jgi:hypothetical protein
MMDSGKDAGGKKKGTFQRPIADSPLEPRVEIAGAVSAERGARRAMIMIVLRGAIDAPGEIRPLPGLAQLTLQALQTCRLCRLHQVHPDTQTLWRRDKGVLAQLRIKPAYAPWSALRKAAAVLAKVWMKLDSCRKF